MKKSAIFIFAFLFSLPIFAQNNQPSPLDGRLYGVVYDVPATKDVTVKENVPYLNDLKIDIYSPPGAKAGDKFPAVIFLNAIGDIPGQAKVKSWGIYRTFPRLVAAHGMVGISMEADGAKIQESLRGLFDFLEKDGARHGIDASRLGVYAASANTTQSIVFLMNENAPKGIRAAALFYGATPAPETRIRKDLPVLFILAEGDLAGGFGQQAVPLWQRITTERAPWTLVFASNLPHAFDAFTDTDESRRIIQQSIAFWKSNLEPVPQPSWKPSPARETVATLYWNDAQKSVEALNKYIAGNANDALAYQQLGRNLAQLQRYDEANAAYEKALSLGSTDAGVYLGLGQMRLGQKRFDEAINFLSKAIEGGARNSFVYGQLAFAQMNLNRNEDALKTYEKAFEAGIPPGAGTRGLAYYNMACAYARLKQNDKAFEMLNKAVDEGFANRRTFETDTDLAPLRADARFQELLKRLPPPVSSSN
jgi:Flp pilus assembly protein TadD/dienelactone hydrolase